MKLEKVISSDAKGKKWTAVFCLCKGESCCADNKKKKVHFGAEGMDDYTLGATDEQRKSYKSRHASGKTAKADTADALSYYILWGDSRSRLQNTRDYKKKFSV
tara:strand:+ start:4029 stop:4337 length:309 start_codon:yes stop_codon:yes gene_type:complete